MRRTGIIDLLMMGLALWLVTESGAGLGQVFRSLVYRVPLRMVIGGFANSGPYGGFVAVTTAVCAAYGLKKHEGAHLYIVSRIALLAALMGILILPSTLSRSAWAGLAVCLAVMAMRSRKVRIILAQRTWLLPLGISAVLVLALVAFVIKKDSAVGRLHIWHMELLAIFRHPLSGVGPGHWPNAYAQAQALYFSAAPRSALEVRVAGCPEYAFNEYLRIGVEYGLVGLALAIGAAVWVCRTLLVKNNPLGYGALALAVFAAGSYPSSVWQFRVLEVFFLISALWEKSRWVVSAVFVGTLCILTVAHRKDYVQYKEAESQWKASRPIMQITEFEGVSEDMKELYPVLRNNYRFVYDYGYALFKDGCYSESIRILSEGTERSCDPMFYNILGRCHEAMGEYDAAEQAYCYSHALVPGRLYPLVLLKEMYERIGREDRIPSVMEEAARIPVNRRNRAMMDLTERLGL